MVRGNIDDLGECPEGWHYLPLGDLADNMFGGGTPSTKHAEFWDGKLPWTTTAVIKEEDIFLERFQRCITGEGLENSSARVAPKGSVLIGTRVGVGKAAVASVDIAINQDITALIPCSRVLPEFLVLALKQNRIQRWFDGNKRGATIKGVPRNDLKKVQILIPPMTEQRAIAHVLRTVQRAKEATEKVIVATRQLKQSLMRHLFTYGPVRFNEADRVSLHETEIGNLPEPWQITGLGEESSIGNGSTPKRTNARYWESGTIPWLTSAKVHDRIIRAADEFVTELARHECHLPLVPKGSLVVAITGQGKTLGNSAILAIDACVSQHLAYVTFCSDRLLPEYALAYLRSRYQELQSVSRSGGSTKGALTCGYLRGVSIPVPSSTEQRRIVKCISALDAKADAEERRKRSIESLFRSLLHGLMTGQIRLPGFASGEVR